MPQAAPVHVRHPPSPGGTWRDPPHWQSLSRPKTHDARRRRMESALGCWRDDHDWCWRVGARALRQCRPGRRPPGLPDRPRQRELPPPLPRAWSSWAFPFRRMSQLSRVPRADNEPRCPTPGGATHPTLVSHRRSPRSGLAGSQRSTPRHHTSTGRNASAAPVNANHGQRPPLKLPKLLRATLTNRPASGEAGSVQRHAGST
jgi:hypothetical protein